MHYNTTHEKGQILIDFTEKSESQKDTIFSLFTNNSNQSFSWTDVAKHFPQINEISLKRALTDLKNEKKLIKTDEKCISKYGRPSYKYKLLTF